MDADQILATGGASGITGVALFILYKLITGKWKVKSMCCGREVSVETNTDTPKPDIENQIKNPMVK